MMNLKDYQKYYDSTPNMLNDTDFNRLSTYFKLLRDVEKPMVSVVIPVFKAKLTLLAHIASLADFKTILPYEVIFIDNNADAETLHILEVLQATVVTETKQGVTNARQKGLEVAKGEVILTMDPDTLYESHYIDKMAIPFFFDKDLILCYSISQSYELGIKQSLKLKIRNMAKLFYYKFKLRQAPMKRMKFIRAVCMAIRKETFSKTGYRTDVKHVGGCDDGLVAIDLNNYGHYKYVATEVYTAFPPPRNLGVPFPYCNEKIQATKEKEIIGKDELLKTVNF